MKRGLLDERLLFRMAECKNNEKSVSSVSVKIVNRDEKSSDVESLLSWCRSNRFYASN